MVVSNDDPPRFEEKEELIAYLAREQWTIERWQDGYRLDSSGADVLMPLEEGHEIIEILEIETDEDLEQINNQIEEHPAYGANRR